MGSEIAVVDLVARNDRMIVGGFTPQSKDVLMHHTVLLGLDEILKVR
jgi:hypothetical protein